jgi:thioesterase domain-containing protein
VANELERLGERVAFVGLLDSYLPDGASASAKQDALLGVAAVFGSLASAAFFEMSSGEREELNSELVGLTAADRTRKVIAGMRERGLLSTDLSPEALFPEVALAETHSQLLQAHRAPVIRAPLFVWWARDRSEDGQARTDWKRQTSGYVTSEEAGGNHFSMIQPPHCETLAARLNECLALIAEPGSVSRATKETCG